MYIIHRLYGKEKIKEYHEKAQSILGNTDKDIQKEVTGALEEYFDTFDLKNAIATGQLDELNNEVYKCKLYKKCKLLKPLGSISIAINDYCLDDKEAIVKCNKRKENN